MRPIFNSKIVTADTFDSYADSLLSTIIEQAKGV